MLWLCALGVPGPSPATNWPLARRSRFPLLFRQSAISDAGLAETARPPFNPFDQAESRLAAQFQLLMARSPIELTHVPRGTCVSSTQRSLQETKSARILGAIPLRRRRGRGRCRLDDPNRRQSEQRPLGGDPDAPRVAVRAGTHPLDHHQASDRRRRPRRAKPERCEAVLRPSSGGLSTIGRLCHQEHATGRQEAGRALGGHRRGPNDRAVTSSKAPSRSRVRARLSARPSATLVVAVSPSATTASSRKAQRRWAASSRTIRASAQWRASTRPGTPPPAPRSHTLAGARARSASHAATKAAAWARWTAGSPGPRKPSSRARSRRAASWSGTLRRG